MIVKHQAVHIGIDHPFRLGPHLRVAAGRVAGRPNLSVLTQQAAVGSHFFDFRRPETRMSDRDGLIQRRPDGFFQRLQQAALKRTFVRSQVRDAGVMQQLLGRKITPRRVVLVQTVDGHPIGSGPRPASNRGAKRIVGAVRDADPIERAQHQRRLGAFDHDPATTQPEFFDTLDGIVSHHRSDRRGDVQIERTDGQRLFRVGAGVGDQAEQQAGGQHHERAKAGASQRIHAVDSSNFG